MITHLTQTGPIFSSCRFLRVLLAITLYAATCQTAIGAEAQLPASRQAPREVSLVVEQPGFDVIIAGGSTAAFAAAIAAAESGARTALIEPTNWVGGQLTSSGVPAIDEAWHTILDPKTKKERLNVAEIARDSANITPSFLKALQTFPNCGECWVSRFCFGPKPFLENQLLPLQRHAGDRLVVFLNTVVKNVETSSDGSRIVSITAIRRTAKRGIPHDGYDRLPSQDLRDWYSPKPSDRFDKETLRFTSIDQPGKSSVFIDATEWGELLALSGAPYLQGVEDHDGGTNGNDRCGQATVFCFVEELNAEAVDEPPRGVSAPGLGFGQYRDMPDAWEKIWTYRRIRGHGPAAPGDLCLQNWGYSLKYHEGGNDYPFGYLFKSRKDTSVERADWHGGIDLTVMAGAERRAFAWHEWFKAHAPKGIDPRQISLVPEQLGTGHGLAKLPYIRDTRRSIGLDGFVLRFADLTGDPDKRTGKVFDDRIALGAYPADVHELSTCKLPKYVLEVHDTLPFYIPFRALTNGKIENMLVAGKTMAQSFLANSATRLHPIEWSTGTAAGVAAAFMARQSATSSRALKQIEELQKLIQVLTPINWTLPPLQRD